MEGNGKSISEQIDVIKLMELVDEKAAISFNINGFDFAGLIRVDDGKYESPIRIRKNEQHLFNFQVIIPDKAKTILKIDTTLAENKSIVNMYRNPDKYEIIHIPNFKTATRSIVGNPTNADPVYDKSHRTISSPFFKTSKEAEIDDKLLRLPEYVGYTPTELTLKWGALTANPASENYDLKTFLENFKSALQLSHVGNDLEIDKLRVVIAEKDKDYQIFNEGSTNLQDLQQVFNQLSTETSIYFDKIIMKAAGKEHYLPQQFLFKIGKRAIAKGTLEQLPANNNALSLFSKKETFTEKKEEKFDIRTANDSTDVNFFHLYPFTYANQAVIRKEKMKNPNGVYRMVYTQKMEDYDRIEAKRLEGEEAIAEFGEAGRKGISYVIFQHKKKKKRIQVDKKNSPLYVYYIHPFFPMITHKLIYDNLEPNDIASIEKFSANSEKAKFYGELGKNGVVEVRFNFPKQPKKEAKEPVKITIKKANPNWSNTTWLRRDSNYSIYLMKNIPLSKAVKLLKKLPANQLDASNLKEDFPIYISIHGGLEKQHDEAWVLSKIQEQFSFGIKEKKELRKVLVLKKGKATSLAEYEYFDKILPKIRTVIQSNQNQGLRTISPGYFKDYEQLIRETFELPLIDETGLFDTKAICLGVDTTSVKAMMKSLKDNYGLTLVEEERLIPVYEIKY